mgnify:CR=1 FL=1
MGVLPHTCAGALLPQPLLAVLAQQAVIMSLISTTAPDYCSTPLLSDPLSHERISRVAGVLDALPSLLPAHVPYVAGKAAAWEQGHVRWSALGVACSCSQSWQGLIACQ